MILRARQFTFHFPGPALVMGIVNVTPDSFSDGGQFLDPDAAVAQKSVKRDDKLLALGTDEAKSLTLAQVVKALQGVAGEANDPAVKAAIAMHIVKIQKNNPIAMNPR